MVRFEVVTRNEQPTAVVHERVAMKELPQFFPRVVGEVYTAMQRQGLVPAGPPFALYLGMPTDTVEVEAGFPVQRPVAPSGSVRASALPGGRCIHTVHVGPYEKLVDTYRELTEWAKAQQLEPRETMWEVYLSDPSKEPDPHTWRTEVFWPVK